MARPDTLESLISDLHGRFNTWLHPPLLKQGELFAQEEVLGSECAARPGNEHEEVEEVARYGRQRRETLCQRSKE